MAIPKELPKSFMYEHTDIPPGALASSFHSAEKHKTYKRMHMTKSAMRKIRRSTHIGIQKKND